MRTWLRQLLCSHADREQRTYNERGVGWYGVRREVECLQCGKKNLPALGSAGEGLWGGGVRPWR